MMTHMSGRSLKDKKILKLSCDYFHIYNIKSDKPRQGGVFSKIKLFWIDTESFSNFFPAADGANETQYSMDMTYSVILYFRISECLSEVGNGKTYQHV